MIPRWLKVLFIVLAVLVNLFIFLLFFIYSATQQTEIAYARKVVFWLQEDRDSALRSEVPEAAHTLERVSIPNNLKQTPGSPLDEICNLQRSNVTHDIIVYLRAKTGDDLGNDPAPWILKYAPKQ